MPSEAEDIEFACSKRWCHPPFASLLWEISTGHTVASNFKSNSVAFCRWSDMLGGCRFRSFLPIRWWGTSVSRFICHGTVGVLWRGNAESTWHCAVGWAGRGRRWAEWFQSRTQDWQVQLCVLFMIWQMDTNGRSVSQLWIYHHADPCMSLELPVQWIFRRKCRRSVLIKGGPNSSVRFLGKKNKSRAGSASLFALMAVLDEHAAWVSECPHQLFLRFHNLFSSLCTNFQDDSRWISLVSLDFRATTWSWHVITMTQPQDGGGQAVHVDISSEIQAWPNMRYQYISCPIQRICKDMQDMSVLGIFISQHQWLSVIQN